MFVKLGTTHYNPQHIISIEPMFLNFHTDKWEIRMSLSNGALIQLYTGTKQEVLVELDEIMEVIQEAS
jgi:hypothetical protein